jgi:long-chain fatty acid transport protein
MKKLFLFIVAISLTATMMAGGLVTNTNQSALFTRLQSRNASVRIDASYYNPAGMTMLNDGFFLSVNNQTVGQTRTITSNYPKLSGEPAPFQPFAKVYDGTVSAPLFPSLYAGYKVGRFAFSAGLTPIGGGGGATYESGLPSFEMQIADLVPQLNAQGFPTSKYSADIFFEGSSIYFGYHVNAAYKVNDIVSLSAGLRLVTAKNTYSGYLKNISINTNYTAFGPTFNGGMVLARDFFTAGATTLGTLAGGATSYSTALTGLMGGGVSPATLLTDVTALTPTDIGTIQAIIGAAGMNPAGINVGTAQAVLAGAAPVFSGGAVAFSTNAAATQDIEVDASQSGTGFTPIFGINLALSEKLNVAFKYEMQTKLELITKVYNNMGGGIFTDGDTVVADMPAMFAAGFEFRPINNLLLTGSMNLYFDNKVDYDGKKNVNINMISKNFKEYGFGAEYTVNDKLRASLGWLGTFTGVNSNYLNDQRYSTNTNTIGGGIGYRITPMIDLNLGGSYTFYELGSKDYNRMLLGNAIPVTETYEKGTWIIAIGADFFFGK